MKHQQRGVDRERWFTPRELLLTKDLLPERVTILLVLVMHYQTHNGIAPGAKFLRGHKISKFQKKKKIK